MNRQHGQAVKKIIQEAQELKSRLETITEEMQELYDEMTERVQDGPRGEKLQHEIDTLEEWADNFDISEEDL